MAELLVMRKNRSHTDPEKDKAVYKRGDVVVVMPDGHRWGRMEDPSTDPSKTFFLIKVPDLSVAGAERFLISDDEPDVVDRIDGEDVRTPGRMLLRRLWRVMADDVPPAVLATLMDTGTITVTREQIRHFIRNKRTGETA